MILKHDNLGNVSGTAFRYIRCSVNVGSLLFPVKCNTRGFEFSKRNRDIIPWNVPWIFVHKSQKNQKVGKYKYQPSKKTSLQSIISLILSSASHFFPQVHRSEPHFDYKDVAILSENYGKSEGNDVFHYRSSQLTF